MSIFHLNKIYVYFFIISLIIFTLSCNKIDNNLNYIETLPSNFETGITEYFLKNEIERIDIQSIYPDDAVKAKCFYFDKTSISVWELFSLKQDIDRETKTNDNATIYFNFCKNSSKKCKSGDLERGGQAIAILNNNDCYVLAGDSNDFNYWTPIYKNDLVEGVQIITSKGDSSGLCKDDNIRRVTWILKCDNNVEMQISNSNEIKASDCNITIKADSKYGKKYINNNISLPNYKLLLYF